MGIDLVETANYGKECRICICWWNRSSPHSFPQFSCNHCLATYCHTLHANILLFIDFCSYYSAILYTCFLSPTYPPNWILVAGTSKPLQIVILSFWSWGKKCLPSLQLMFNKCENTDMHVNTRSVNFGVKTKITNQIWMYLGLVLKGSRRWYVWSRSWEIIFCAFTKSEDPMCMNCWWLGGDVMHRSYTEWNEL
jgi:hypothetical protein